MKMHPKIRCRNGQGRGGKMASAELRNVHAVRVPQCERAEDGEDAAAGG